MEDEKTELTSKKSEGKMADTTVMQPGEPYFTNHGAGAKGEGYDIAAGGNSPAGDAPVVKQNPQGETRGDASFVEAAKKYQK